MALVNLEWKYKGEIITTSCIVSNKEGLIYDDILINININVYKSSNAFLFIILIIMIYSIKHSIKQNKNSLLFVS